MKNAKNVKALLLAVLMLCSLTMLAACGGGGEVSGNVNYEVTIVDALGNPYTSGVVVKYMQNGQQAGMQVVNESGVAAKEMPKGEYTVELQFTSTDVEYTFDSSNLTLTADAPKLSIVVSQALGEQTRELFVKDDALTVHFVQTGCTQITLNPEGRSYFLYAPTEAGHYEFSVVGSDAAIGYYGAPHFVQENSAAEVVDNKFDMSIRASMIGTGESGTTVLVIGVDAGEGDAVLAIERVGDPEWSVEDEPWTVYEPTVTLAPYTLPAGTQLKDFDLKAATDTYKLVLNESEGFYHLDSADGPLVLVRLGAASAENSKYLDPFETILERSGVNKYFFDAEGNFVKKENYSDCLLEYIENVDEQTGLYPLTADLMYIIQQRGDHSGWFDPDGSLYLFTDEDGNNLPGINNEISWLFMCCYTA